MFKVNDIPVKSTIFPDGTSQMWKLPDGLFDGAYTKIVWNFEAEREIMDLFSLVSLIPNPRTKHTTLFMPYLPYARQDKEITNNNTFNLRVFARMINSLEFNRVAATDVHNPDLTKQLINNFVNIHVENHQVDLISRIKPDYLVFPDAGARDRYKYLDGTLIPPLIFEKYRHQGSGVITEHNIINVPIEGLPHAFSGTRFLVIDDLCDGGATFISIAKTIKKWCPDPDLFLYVTHGVFSKGLTPLTDVGYKVYTTNSLIKNVEGFPV